MDLLYIFLILVFFISLFIMCYVTYYNRLQDAKTRIEQAEGIIDETLRARYDLVVRMSDLVKTNLKEKKDYFKEYVQLKNEKISNFDMDRKLKEAIGMIYNLRNDYPELQKNADVKEIITEIKATNEKMTATIAYYNRYTSELNALIRKFPSNLISKIHHFEILPFFDKKDMQDDDILDFKL